MRAVDLSPTESRRSGTRGAPSLAAGPAQLVVLLLAAAVVLTLLAVLTDNTISERRAKLASVRAQVVVETEQAVKLSQYTTFVDTARQRADTVRQIALSRFDWHNSLRELARVVPANTSFQSLDGSVAPGAAAGGTSGLRGDINAPAFEIAGCTSTQDDVAHLIYRLRSIPGVTRVTLSSTAKSGSAAAGASPSSGAAAGCAGNSPSFDLVVFFAPLTGTGTTAAAGATAATGTAASTTATTATGSSAVPVSGSGTTATGTP